MTIEETVRKAVIAQYRRPMSRRELWIAMVAYDLGLERAAEVAEELFAVGKGANACVYAITRERNRE